MTLLKRISLLLLLCGAVHAAKVPVEWDNPTTNTDGSVLTDLSYIEVEWGSCSGTAFGTKQASMIVATTAVGAHIKSFIYPSGMSKVCVRAYAFNMKGVSSVPSNVAVKDLLPVPAKPVTLDQPVILSFNNLEK